MPTPSQTERHHGPQRLRLVSGKPQNRIAIAHLNPLWTLSAAAFALFPCRAAAALPSGGASTGTATQADVILLVAYVLLALIFSFLCSIAEAVLLSTTPAYIAGLHGKNPRLAKLLKRLKQDNVDQSLAAILTLNTIAHTVGAIGSGSKATAVFGNAWFGLFSALMTLMILFLSEIIPKTIGAVYWRSLTGPTARFVRMLIWVLYPLIWASEWLTRLIAGNQKAHVFSRHEFVAMAGIGEQDGKLDPRESRIITNLFRLGALTAQDVLTPRTVITALPRALTVDAALNVTTPVLFSRLPLYERDLDHISGFILKDDLLLAKAQGRGQLPLESLQREIKTVPGTLPLSKLLAELLEQRQHIALVIDAYGGTKGLVTLEDVVETLLGTEIVDEMDGEADMQALARRKWKKRVETLGLDVVDPTLRPPPK